MDHKNDPRGTWTPDMVVNSHPLYRLSYRVITINATLWEYNIHDAVLQYPQCIFLTEMQETGIEPVWSYLRGILSPLRLPIPPLLH